MATSRQLNFNMFSAYNSKLPDESLESLGKLKDVLTESNNTAIGNMHCLSANFVLLRDYVKSTFKVMIQMRQIHQQRQLYLTSIIRKHGLTYQLEKDQNDTETYKAQLATINQKITNSILQKGEPSRADETSRATGKTGRTDRSQKNRPPSRKEAAANGKYEQYLVTSYVGSHLKQNIEYDFDGSSEIQKSALLNMFISWVEDNKLKIEFQNLSNIQMALTNEVKRHFPKAIHNYRAFRGIRLKEEQKNLLKLSDAKANFQKEDDSSVQSPPLPQFQDDHLANDF